MQKIHNNSQFPHLYPNTRILVDEFLRRGIELWLIDDEKNMWMAAFNGHKEFLCDIQSLKTPFSAFNVFTHKGYTKELLAMAGISVPEGRMFSYSDVPNALVYARQLGFPVVVKPSCGTHGDGVWTDLGDRNEVRLAIEANRADLPQDTDFIIERHFHGEEYRVFITKNRDFAMIHREPAYVIGDGEHDIKTLADIESEQRKPPRRNCLCEIVIDDKAEAFLKRQGLALRSIPQKGQKIYLHGTSNLKKGGMATDFTGQVHPSVIDICFRVIEATLGLPYAGVDFMSTDITVLQTPETYAILEINPDAGIGMHVNPGKGKSRPVQAMIADVIFPETRR